MALTDSAIRALKTHEKAYKATDEKGLYLYVTPSGGRLWKLKFRTAGGTEKKLSLGAYPDVTLKDARALRDAARRQLAKGVGPAEKKQHDKRISILNAANTFGAVAELFIAKLERDGLAANTIIKRRWFLRLLQKSLGHRPMTEIQPFDVLAAVRPYEAAKNDEKAHRTMQFVGSVFRFGIANQLATSDPTRDLRGALAKRKPKHHAAILESRRVGELLRAIEGFRGKACPPCASRCSYRLMSPSGPANCGVLNGAKLTSTTRYGAFQPRG